MQQRLLQATEHLISEGATFTELSVERLTAQAGISRATFYIYFQDKGDLVRRLAQTVMAELQEASRRWWEVADKAVRADLHDTLGAIVAVYRRHEAVFAALVETATYDADVAQEYHALMQGIVDATRAVIERGQAAGVMRPVAPAETASVLAWMVERSCYQLLRNTDTANDAQIAEALTDVIWTTLYREDHQDAT